MSTKPMQRRRRGSGGRGRTDGRAQRNPRRGRRGAGKSTASGLLGSVGRMFKRPGRDGRSGGRRTRADDDKVVVRTRMPLRDYMQQRDPVPSPVDGPIPLAGLTEAERYEAYKSAYARNSAHFDERPGYINILGVRGMLPNGHVSDNAPDAYNDLIAFIWSDDGARRCEEFKASVDPGRKYTKEPFYPDKGCANLFNGQFWYQIGLHRGSYEALVQAGDVVIHRDHDRDYFYDEEELVESGLFGINIHAGGTGESVNAYSAGCQVIHGGSNGGPYQRAQDIWNLHPESTMVYTLMDRGQLGYEFCPGKPRVFHVKL